MQGNLQNHLWIKIDRCQISLVKRLGWGLFGGLAATLFMDIVLMSILVIARQPALACFSIVGNTVVSLFSINVAGPAGSIPLGAAAHYLIGPLMGALFGTAAAKFSAYAKADVNCGVSRKKIIILAVLYAEILSQPLLAMAPLLLPMTASEMLQWFGGSLVMHLIWGVVMGMVWSLGQHPVTLNNLPGLKMYPG